MSSRSALVGYRHLVAFILFLIFFLINVQRLGTTIAIVAMVNHTYKEPLLPNNSSKVKVCMSFNGSTDNVEEIKAEGEFHWSTQIQGYIFGIYFIGMISALLPSAKLCQIFEARRVALCSCIMGSLATLLIPLASRWHVYAFIVLQLLRGIGAGAMNAVIFSLMGNWFPKSERGLLSTFVITGYSCGAIFATAISGWICDHPSLGWPVIFYMSGCFGIFISILISTNLYERPISCPRISEAEMKYLATDEGQVSMQKKASPPWNKIFTSIPIHALMFGMFGHYWMLSYFWSVQSTFLGTIQHFSNIKNGFVSALPFLLKAIGEYSSSSICHCLLNKQIVGVNVLRRSSDIIGSVGISASILGMYFGGCNDYVIAGASLSTMFFVGVCTSGAMITCMDMSPRFAASLAGVMNTIGGIPTVIVPVLVGYLTKNETLEEWKIVFIISIAVVMCCSLIFTVFGSAELQSWNFVKDEAHSAIAFSSLKVHKNENTNGYLFETRKV